VDPGQSTSVCRNLAIGAVAQGIVYVEARLFGQVYATGGDERQPALVQRLFEADEGDFNRVKAQDEL
jgi:hypothetical protein